MADAPPEKPQNLQQFVELLKKSRVLSEQRIDELLGRFHPAGESGSLFGFGELLIHEGQLTLWQFDNLRNGRWKGFYLDRYKLPDVHHADESRSYYTALDVDSGESVILAIWPKQSATDNTTRYEVLPPAIH